MNNIEQQAKELVGRFQEVKTKMYNINPEFENLFYLSPNEAKQCAIISIDLIIQEYGTYYKVPNEEGKYISYWQQVKNYIQTKM